MDKIQLQDRTKQFAIRIFKLVDKLPAKKASDVVAYQLLKSSSSTAANYRSACRAKSKADFINKLKTVEEEADESLFWLELIIEVGLVQKKLMADITKEASELVAIFTSALKTSKQNRNS
ncbi:MAG: four helix bundle protein [Flavobacteriales bacterium]|nr:MAG: four helix bundle protein [Flavobacteriales bacterium]